MGAYPSNFNDNLTPMPVSGFRVRVLDQQGNYIDLDNPMSIEIGDSTSRDAFGNLRVSQKYTLFESIPGYGLNLNVMDTYAVGFATATWNSQYAGVDLNLVTTASGNRIVRQSRAYCPYYPGNSQYILTSFVLKNEDTTNVVKRIGYFDDFNGIFFEEQDNVRYMVWRNSTLTGIASDSKVRQSDWNVDPMDGTGPSNLDLDFSKDQILFTDLQWPAGRVRTGFLSKGTLYIAHEYNFEIIEVPYIRSGTLPVRHELVNLGTANTACTMKEISATVATEGSNPYNHGLNYAVSNGVDYKSVTSREPILTIRKAANLNGLVYHGAITPTHFDFWVDVESAYYEIVLNGTVSGGIWSGSNPNSGVEYNTSATSISGGTVIRSGFLSGTRQNSTIYTEDLTINTKMGKSYLGTSDTLSCVITSFSATATHTSVALSYVEWY